MRPIVTDRPPVNPTPMPSSNGPSSAVSPRPDLDGLIREQVKKLLGSSVSETPTTLTVIANFWTSPVTDKLDAALAKAQGQVQTAIKDKENPAFARGGKGTKYADINAIWEACREALSSNGVVVTQWPRHDADGLCHVITRVAHAGQWMMADMGVPVMKKDAQGYGSAITYLRRYSLQSVVGVAADEDDDGNNASGKDKSADKNKEKETRADQNGRTPTKLPKATTELRQGSDFVSQPIGTSKKNEFAHQLQQTGWTMGQAVAWCKANAGGKDLVSKLTMTEYQKLVAHMLANPVKESDFAEGEDFGVYSDAADAMEAGHA